ncbi:HTH domain-containing protein [Haloarcula litorea]|uniref:HTH domain-containing protein n=1 Tax=Haloarcula litorea TaxID=3032579 RepID=UPI0023E8BA4C|nr:HTH domain-containing protein [Halomicroarcula sp. GDY20]
MSNRTKRSRETDSIEDEPTDSASPDGLTVDLWTRRPVCGPRTTVIDRLSSLRAAGKLADFSITTWPEEIVVSGRTEHSDLLDTIEEFEAWAEDNDVTLRPPFETRTASLLVGASEEVLTTPMMLAAAYDGDDLVAVYPCRDGDQTWTIGAFLEALDGEPGDPVTDPERLPGLATR